MTIVAKPPAPRRYRLASAVVLVVAMLSLAQGNAQAPAPPTAPPQAGSPPTPAVPVSVTAAGKRDVPIVLRAIVTVQANQTAAIRTRVDGTLEQVFFTEGQEVRHGDLLARIDARPYQAVLDQALARRAANAAALANAQLDLARSADLARNQFASRQVVDTRAAVVAQLEATLKSDDAAIGAARVNLDYTNITAPFDGRVGLRQVDPGNILRFADNASIAIVTLSQIKPIVVLFTLPQDALPTIQAAMAKAKLPVAALSPDDKVVLGLGELLTTDSSVDAATGTIRLKAVFPNPETRLWPGQFVNVRLQLELQRGVVTVPSVAVQRGPNGLFIYVVKDDSTVEVVRVELGQDDGTTAIVRKGIEEGTQIVVAGQSRLRGGSRISVAAPKPSG